MNIVSYLMFLVVKDLAQQKKYLFLPRRYFCIPYSMLMQFQCEFNVMHRFDELNSLCGHLGYQLLCVHLPPKPALSQITTTCTQKTMNRNREMNDNITDSVIHCCCFLGNNTIFFGLVFERKLCRSQLSLYYKLTQINLDYIVGLLWQWQMWQCRLTMFTLCKMYQSCTSMSVSHTCAYMCAHSTCMHTHTHTFAYLQNEYSNMNTQKQQATQKQYIALCC